MLVRELHRTLPIAAGAGLKQCCASINFSNIPDWSWNQGFFFLFSPMPGIWYLVLFCGWSEFSTVIFMSRGTRIDDETLQNCINEHTVDLENIQRIPKKGKGRIYKMFS